MGVLSTAFAGPGTGEAGDDAQPNIADMFGGLDLGELLKDIDIGEMMKNLGDSGMDMGAMMNGLMPNTHEAPKIQPDTTEETDSTDVSPPEPEASAEAGEPKMDLGATLGGMDINKMMENMDLESLMQNPEMMEMASNMMQNMDPDMLNNIMGSMTGQGQPSADAEADSEQEEDFSDMTTRSFRAFRGELSCPEFL